MRYLILLLLSPIVLMVELDPVEYTVAEGESASLTAVLNFVADRDVSVDLITQNGTAEGETNQPQSTK